MKLYGYWRSTTSYRVRIALNLTAGEQHAPRYTAQNLGQGVPTLVLDDGTVLTQSMAILDWLEEVHPDPALLPIDAVARAHLRVTALSIASDIHPVNNLRVVARLRSMGQSQDEAVTWMNHWMTDGLSVFCRLIDPATPFCFGGAPGLADICLIPQLYSAHRWGCDLSPLARLTGIEARWLALAAFDAARHEHQPDAL